MFGRLMPTEGKFFELFVQHGDLCVKGAKEMVALMSNFTDLEMRVHAIESIEKQADKVTHNTLELLHKTFITPLDRDHIHQLVNAMDDICDLIQDTSESLSLYDVKAITPEAARLADISVKCAERVKDVVELVGRQDRKFEPILKTCEEIDRLESDADRVMRSAVSKLFREEKDVREVMKMHAIYQLLESITDRCLDVANLAEGISLENS